MIYNKSIKAFKESIGLIPGGVNSPVRAFKSVNCNPVFFDYGYGSNYMILTETNTLIVFHPGDHLFLDMLIKLPNPK